MDIAAEPSRPHPFAHHVDPTVFYRSPIHEGARIALVAAAKTQTGLLILSGEPGTGKTAVLQHVVCTVEEAGTRVLRFSAFRPLHEMFPPPWGESFLGALQARVRSAGASVVAVDDAERLRPTELELLCDLVHAERATGRQLAILLAGQPALDVKLTSLEGDRVERALALRVRLTRMDASDVRAYMAHQLQRAGLRLDDVFEADAVDRVAEYTQGCPRRINQLCHAALHGATQVGLTMVSASGVEAAAGRLELDLPRSHEGTAKRGPRAGAHGAASAGAMLGASASAVAACLMAGGHTVGRRIMTRMRGIATAAAAWSAWRSEAGVWPLIVTRTVGRAIARSAHEVLSAGSRWWAWGASASGAGASASTAGRRANQRTKVRVAHPRPAKPWSPDAGFAALVLTVMTLMLAFWPMSYQPPAPERPPPSDADLSLEQPEDTGLRPTVRAATPAGTRYRGTTRTSSPTAREPATVSTFRPRTDR